MFEESFSLPKSAIAQEKNLIQEKANDDIVILDKIIAKKSSISLEEKGWSNATIRKTELYVNTIAKHEAVMTKLLASQGIETNLEKIGRKLFKIHLDKKDAFLENLPPGYMYRGGAARAVLHRKLGIDTFATPRDIDIAFGGYVEDKQVSDKLAQKFSPDDFASGYGVDAIDETYFEQQDFTLNEILATNESIYLTSKCLLDNARGILRISEYEKQESYRDHPYYVNPKLLAKALRFVADKNVEFWNDDVFEFQCIDYFHIALHFDRAWETSYENASRYIHELHKYRQISEEIQTPEELLEFLDQEVSFVFRHARKSDIAAESDFLEQNKDFLMYAEDEYQNYPLRQSFTR